MTTTDRLPCGAYIDELIAQAAEGAAADRTAHHDRCPHCQAALAEYDRLFAPVRELATELVHVPDGLMEEILRGIRSAGSDPAYGLIPGPRGDTRIAGRVVAVTARITTEQTPGVRVALAHPVDPSGEGVVAGVAGRSTSVRITLAASYGEDLHALAGRIRSAVARAVEQGTGLRPAEITVVVDDVFEVDG